MLLLQSGVVETWTLFSDSWPAGDEPANSWPAAVVDIESIHSPTF